MMIECKRGIQEHKWKDKGVTEERKAYGKWSKESRHLEWWEVPR